MAKKSAEKYENNPFMIGIEGLKLVFSHAKSTGIYAIVLTTSTFVLGVIFYIAMIIADIASGGQQQTSTSFEINQLDPASALITVGLFAVGTLLYMAISLLLFGPLEYAAAMTAQGKKVSLKEGFNVTIKNFGGYFWLYILYLVKVLLWSLLFIVPGVIMFNRYLLSGTVFFAEGKRGNSAIKRSAELTKGAWLTTYAGTWIWSILSQGLTMVVFWPGSLAVLYRQLVTVTDTKEVKPKAHILSWLTLLVPYALLLLYILFMVLLFILIAASATAP